MDVVLLACLILLNGVFAMSEMALTASRKARLAAMIEAGDLKAQAALTLHLNPTKFLSVVQIGITSIGVLNGIVGEAAFSEPLAAVLRDALHISPKAASISATGLVVFLITVLTIIFGELVPKRLGQMFPETVARRVAQPMEWLSWIAQPLVKVLSWCTVVTLRLLGATGPARVVTEEEIAASLEEGFDAGVIEAQEHQMLRNVFRLDDRPVGSMMIPRNEIVWLDVGAPQEAVLEVIGQSEHSRYPVCRGGLGDVLGIVSAQSLLQQTLRGEALALTEQLQAAVYVPETLSGMELLEQFRATSAQLLFVVDEYGDVQGVITVRDVLEAIAGEFTNPTDVDTWAVQRPDGSWLFDGLIPVPELKDRLNIKELPQEDRGRYNTLAGMVVLLLGRLAQTADAVEWDGWRFEVVDLDGKRIDKVLASPLPKPVEGDAG